MKRAHVVLSCSILVLAAQSGLAGTIMPIFSIALRATQNIPGIGNVTTINNLAVNNQGKWLVQADTDHPDTTQDEVMLLSGVVQYRQGQMLAAPAGAGISSFDSVNLNNHANSGWNFFLTNLPSNADSGIFWNATLVLQEGTISSSPVFGPNTPYIGFFDAKINDSDQIMVVASIDDPNIPTTVDRAMVILNYNSMMGTYTESVISKEGDLILGNAIADFGTGPHESAINNNGDILYLADTTAATTVDGFLMRNNTVLLQEGTTEIEPGRFVEFVLGRGVDLNDNGDWVIRSNLTGNTADDECIITNGTIFVREGQNIPAIGAFSFENFGLAASPIKIDNSGNIVWYGDWNDPDTSRDTGLFWNHQLIVQEGVTMVDGLLVLTINNGQDSFDLSDDGQWLIFECTLRDVAAGINYNSAVLVRIPTPGALSLALVAGLLALRRRR